MNSQNNNENSNNTDTADKETKHYDNIYSNSNNQPSQTGESAASDDEKGNVQYADRSIRDDINDYKFVKSYKSHGHHKHHHHHHSSKENSDDVLLVQSSRPAKGSSNKIKKKSLSTGNEKYLLEYDELVKSNHPAMGSKEQKKAIRENQKIKKRRFKKWQRVILTIISTILALVLVVSGLLVWFIYNGSKELLDNTNIISAPSNVVVQNGGQYVVYNGQTYEFNKNMTSILCMGIDKSSFDGASDIKGENGQADVLILVAMDTSTGETKLIKRYNDRCCGIFGKRLLCGNCKRTDLSFICLRRRQGVKLCKYGYRR